MSTIRLSTAYQLVMTALLLGALLGLIAQQLPISLAAAVPSVRAMVAEEAPLTVLAMSAHATQPSTLLATATPTQGAVIVGQQTFNIIARDEQNGRLLVCCQAEQLVWIPATDDMA
ncbi:hypothetical protein KC957_00155, partial [Candidatus Saccharibacteria bacterium]|nr:hypothetical protein [Candidatus Saccharibacteria bacterium]